MIQVTVVGTNITAVTPIATAKAPILAQQNAAAVAITGGVVGGVTLPLGTMAQQNSGAVAITGGRITLVPTDVNGGLQVNDSGASDRVALRLGVNAGTNKANIFADGTALNYLGGNLGIKNAAPTYDLDVNGVVRIAQRLSIGMTPTGNSLSVLYPGGAGAVGIDFYPVADNGYACYFRNSVSAAVGNIVTSSTTTTYATSSDGRLKEAVEALLGGLDTILALRPVRFLWTADGSPGRGFVAQEVQPLIPEAVSGTPDAVDAAGQMIPMGMDLSKLVPYLVGAVQELAQQVAALTARLEAAGG